jgi:Periplasmic copper-binding protein (NosD)
MDGDRKHAISPIFLDGRSRLKLSDRSEKWWTRNFALPPIAIGSIIFSMGGLPGSAPAMHAHDQRLHSENPNKRQPMLIRTFRLLLQAFFTMALTFKLSAQEAISPIDIEVSGTLELRRAAAAIAPGTVSGGTIRLRAGTYDIDAPLVFRNNHYVNLIGSGSGTLIRKRGNGNAIEFRGCWFSGIENIWIRQEEGMTSGSGVYLRDSCVCRIGRCRFDRFAESGVRFDGQSSSPMSSNRVDECWFQNNKGPQLFSFANNDFFFLGNQFGANGAAAGALLVGSSAGTYTMNYHWGNDVGLKLGPGSHFNRIENNRFEESAGAGLMIGDASTSDVSQLNIITGNTIHTNSKGAPGRHSAVVAYGAIDVVFTSNQVFSWDSEKYHHKHALELGDGCARWIIKDNTFRHHANNAVSANPPGSIIKDNIDLRK